MASKLITEKELGARVKRMVADADDVMIAVAFWGDGSLESLGLSEARGGRVIVNLQSGSTNPKVIERLRDLRLFDVRTLGTLHAKVYCAGGQAIIGSSNASANGLGLEGAASICWDEANIATSDALVVADLRQWFDRLWKNSSSVTSKMLREAQELWEERSRRARTRWVVQAGETTLLSACFVDPSLLEGENVLLALYKEQNSAAAREAVREDKARVKDRPLELTQDLPLKKRWLAFDGWALPPDTWIIDCHVNGTKSRVWALARTGSPVVHTVTHPEEGTIFVAFKERAIILNGVSFKLSPQERAIIEGAAPKLLPRGEDVALVPLREVLPRLKRAAKAS